MELQRMEAEAPAGQATADPAGLLEAIRGQLAYGQGRTADDANARELFQALAHAIRDRLVDRWLETEERYREAKARRVSYISMEFHIGRLLRSALQSLQLEDEARQALASVGARLEDLEEEEPDAGLGSGGLGRLAACFMDSLATLDLPGRGYGLRYELGLFRQVIQDGRQVEEPDNWLRKGTPWELVRPDEAVLVDFDGHVEATQEADGSYSYKWVDTEQVVAIPHDVPVPGYGTGTVSTLRLWSAHPRGVGLDLRALQRGDYAQAWGPRNLAQTITAFLYPAEHTPAGKELRVMQQFFLSSATLQDLIRRHLQLHPDLSEFADKTVIQLNDTHPALAIPELMRLLMDKHGYGWEPAWSVVQQVFAYTNHTLLPEALETWSAGLLGRLLPRHMQIIREIDRRFEVETRESFPTGGMWERVRIIEPHHYDERVRMANLAVVGSFSVNGVAELHTELLKNGLLRDLRTLYPERFNCKTNGITPRRWLTQANPRLAELISGQIGSSWERDLDRLRDLERFAGDAAFQSAFREVKLANKRTLAQLIRDRLDLEVDPHSLFDIQIKRFHEYKRQLLLVLWVIHRYLALCEQPELDVVPRTVLFAGKAAPDYHRAKQIIRLIHDVAALVNHDERVGDKLKLVFLPNYSVSLAQVIIPAADVSEQISTAGYEASGTGNMKLSLNGALTLGTLDGANVEIRSEVGGENIFIMGLQAHEVREARERGYRPRERYQEDARLRAVLDAIAQGRFSPDEPGRYASLVESLLEEDVYFLLADFASYLFTQERLEDAFREEERWTRMAIINVARMGKFSSDRTIRQYADDIWRLRAHPVPVASEG